MYTNQQIKVVLVFQFLSIITGLLTPGLSLIGNSNPTDEGQVDIPSWLQLETPDPDNKNISLCTCLFSDSTFDKSTRKDFVLRNSLRILRRIKVANKIPKDSIYIPICQNPFFKPGQLDVTCTIWKRKGIITLADLYIDTLIDFASFAQLCNKYNIPNSHFFRYLQVRHYVKQRFEHFETIPTSHPFYDNLMLAPESKHFITKFVDCFTVSVSSDFLRQAWASDLQSDVSAELWEKALSLVHSCSINTRYRLIQYKVIHRLHYSKIKLNKIFPSVSTQCDKCSSAEGSLAHMFWFCPQLFGFWSAVFKWYSKCYSKDILPNHNLAIFGCSTETLDYTSDLQMALQLGMVVAKKLVLLNWKSTTSPSFDHWLKEMVSVIQIERLRQEKQDKRNRHVTIWRPFLAQCLITT
ncbi:uncharacterized protein LOC114427641 [Parambassis ranga]|uniref:Uncharacterized protein LOC114427641 n=1 Tax=Parambassis ranga TaxID=210632 RepID=A0A6P7HM29_9TELE|nr:uncharacterized protein LOC114427641 [Parambassis ranga]